jgi:hypothetical protein
MLQDLEMGSRFVLIVRTLGQESSGMRKIRNTSLEHACVLMLLSSLDIVRPNRFGGTHTQMFVRNHKRKVFGNSSII